MEVDEQVPLRTLLVEDNRSEAALVSRLLMMAKTPRFDVITAHRLQDAVDILDERRVDLVILDLGLPDVATELEGVKALHHRHPDIPVVVLTGVQEDDQLRRQTLDAGATDCLFKEGINPEKLHEGLAEAVHRSRRAWAETLRLAEGMARRNEA